MPSTGYRAGFLGAAVALLVLGGAASTRAEPVTVAIALDTSGSIKRDELQRARELCANLRSHLPPGSDAGLITFDDRERLLLPWGSTAEDVRRALAIVGPTGRFTALHDALYEASRKLRDAPARRRAIVLITDGRDEGSTLTLEDGLRVAQDGHIPIWTVGLGRVQDRVLKRIAKLTGGDYVPLATAAPNSMAARIASVVTAAAATPATSSAPPRLSETEVREARPAAELARPSGRRSGVGLAVGAGVGLVALVGWLARRRRERRRCPVCDLELTGPLADCPSCSMSRARPTAARAPVRVPAPAVVSRPVAQAVEVEASRIGGDTLERQAPLALVAGMKRQAARFSSAPPPALSPALLERMNNTEEYLEKTVTLTERPVLVITSGPGTGRVFNLNPDVVTSVGRARLNDIVLEDLSVSSEHCRIRPADGGFTVLDLRSTNGTYVNDERVASHPLAAGDVLTVGETHLVFRMDHQRAS